LGAREAADDESQVEGTVGHPKALGTSDVSARKGFENHVSDLILEIWNATAFPWREGLHRGRA
jgi:hypothetical protein